MIADLHATFLPQFVTLARSRVERVLDIAMRRDHAAVGGALRELHSLVGEAGLLGLRSIVPLARDCEEKASRLRATQTEAEATALVSALHELERGIALVAVPPPQEAGHE